MPREVEPSLNERDFIRQALRENLRLDGRSFDQHRNLDLVFGDEYGIADVRLGKTRYQYPLFHCFVMRWLTAIQSHRPRIS